jgi:hypothetical protein
LLGLGLLVQMQVKHDHVLSFRDQQLVWQELLAQAPTLADGTDVLIVVRGDTAGLRDEGWQRAPLAVWWEVSAAVRLLYGNPTLRGDLVFADLAAPNEPQLAAEGIDNPDRDAPVPYAQVVAFVYEPLEASGGGQVRMHLRRLQELPAAWVTGAAGPTRLCRICDTGAPAAHPALGALQEFVRPQTR